MADIDKIHTDLPMVLNRKFYNDLVENFTIIKSALSEFSTRLDQLSKQYDDLDKKELHTELITETGTRRNVPTSVDINDSDSSILK